MDSRNSKAIIVAVFAGILLLISGVSGLATWEAIKNFVTDNVIDNYIVQIIFVVLIFIASLGGISVIIGGLLIGKDKISFFSVGAIGLILSIVARLMVKKD